MSKSHLKELGESELAEAQAQGVTNLWQLIALVLMKYGLIGVVIAYFGWMNWQAHMELVTLVRQNYTANTETARAVDELIRVVERFDGKAHIERAGERTGKPSL